VDRRLLGRLGRGFGLGGATGGQQVSLPPSRPPWTAPPEQRRRSSPSRPPGHHGPDRPGPRPRPAAQPGEVVLVGRRPGLPSRPMGRGRRGHGRLPSAAQTRCLLGRGRSGPCV
jgi:hypothetical protein